MDPSRLSIISFQRHHHHQQHQPSISCMMALIQPVHHHKSGLPLNAMNWLYPNHCTFLANCKCCLWVVHHHFRSHSVVPFNSLSRSPCIWEPPKSKVCDYKHQALSWKWDSLTTTELFVHGTFVVPLFSHGAIVLSLAWLVLVIRTIATKEKRDITSERAAPFKNSRLPW